MIDRVVKSSKAKCGNKEAGCRWIGEIFYLEVCITYLRVCINILLLFYLGMYVFEQKLDFLQTFFKEMIFSGIKEFDSSFKFLYVLVFLSVYIIYVPYF